MTVSATSNDYYAKKQLQNQIQNYKKCPFLLILTIVVQEIALESNKKLQEIRQRDNSYQERHKSDKEKTCQVKRTDKVLRKA